MTDTDDLSSLFSQPVPEENKIYLTAEEWEGFMAALDAPPVPNVKLRDLLLRKQPWDEDDLLGSTD